MVDRTRPSTARAFSRVSDLTIYCAFSNQEDHTWPSKSQMDQIAFGGPHSAICYAFSTLRVFKSAPTAHPFDHLLPNQTLSAFIVLVSEGHAILLGAEEAFGEKIFFASSAMGFHYYVGNGFSKLVVAVYDPTCGLWAIAGRAFVYSANTVHLNPTILGSKKSTFLEKEGAFFRSTMMLNLHLALSCCSLQKVDLIFLKNG
ncbi:hypothetical protein O6H91_06G116300 [Diphasiastrum complanatum]|uniref:Uncharacterized protein n=1 Tax=Diphasiastrum complanatum TaxID=34168 RepID=A0ACC2DHS4_DIPCM|nr:hypothetical protein O6H91_06G116300 [Diphasiastrum complanatum]